MKLFIWRFLVILTCVWSEVVTQLYLRMAASDRDDWIDAIEAQKAKMLLEGVW